MSPLTFMSVITCERITVAHPVLVQISELLLLQNVTVRVETASENGTWEEPVMVVVREKRSILSWTVPLFLEG